MYSISTEYKIRSLILTKNFFFFSLFFLDSSTKIWCYIRPIYINIRLRSSTVTSKSNGLRQSPIVCTDTDVKARLCRNNTICDTTSWKTSNLQFKINKHGSDRLSGQLIYDTFRHSKEKMRNIRYSPGDFIFRLKREKVYERRRICHNIVNSN